VTSPERPAFLVDENTAPRLAAALRREAPDIRVYVVGQDPAPRRGTPDPELLRWIEATGCLLVTSNRDTMPGRLREHIALGGHVPGILVIRRRLTIWRPLLEDLLLIWEAAPPDEYRDRIAYLPL
jgi:hypothetical protein